MVKNTVGGMIYTADPHHWLGSLVSRMGLRFVNEAKVQEVNQGEWMPIVEVPREHLAYAMLFLRNHEGTQMRQLVEITGVDYPERAERFEVVYQLLSHTLNQRLTVKVQVGESQSVPSVCDIYPNADWAEREVYDLFGIVFEGHPDLRRILTDYGFQGHPLRKDFPCTGYVDVRYDEAAKRVIQEPIELAQEMRQFDYGSPWESAALPPRTVRVIHSYDRPYAQGAVDAQPTASKPAA